MRYTVRTVVFHAAERIDRMIVDDHAAQAALRPVFDAVDADREHFAILAIDVRGRMLGAQIVATGTATACLVHPREVFRAAIAFGAVSIVVAHNHPSGDVTPSPEDFDLARRLRQAGEVIGIPVVDQLILSADGAYRGIA